jgi:alkanesulfonate monooxygenase SsuD/methylene tetrahydromethanopterin reductase-like flavin-dependent oxidoreductase (luciferase family)
MKFGVFDHTDATGESLGVFYENRLRLAETYDRCGLYGYHVAEHHCTPLGMAPSPSVLLGALTQRTKRLRFGPLVYLLPMHHPLRLVEEICMIDQLSNGRLMLGVGRGASPLELQQFGGDYAEAEVIFTEALQCILRGLHESTLTFEGKHFHFKDVPVVLKPVQKPHPQLWYGAIRPESADWAAANDVNLVLIQLRAGARQICDRYRDNWAKLGRSEKDLPLLGISRHIVVAKTDAEAKAIARRAYQRWRESFDWLWRRNGVSVFDTTTAGILFPTEWEALEAIGNGCAGSPETVRRFVAEEMEAATTNYLCSWFAFGDLRFDEVVQSVDLFSQYVMPAFSQGDS